MLVFAQDFGSGLTPAKRLNLRLSKSADEWPGAASVAYVGVGTPRLRQIVTIVAPIGWEVCDGGHRMFVMNRGSPFRYLPASKQVEIMSFRRLKLSCEVH